MGYYINVDSEGNRLNPTGKGEALIKDGGVKTEGTYKENLIAIVDNGSFEAAGYMFSEDEFKYFEKDGRVKNWLTHPKAKELAGYV